MESENQNIIPENPIVPEIKEEPIIIPVENQIKELTQEEKDSLNKKFTEVFQDKLSNYISKFSNDIETIERMMYEFSDLYYELENIKSDINEHFTHRKSLSNNNPSATARDTDKPLLTSANAKSSKNNENMRSKTPTKLKSNKIVDLKESHNATAKNETARNYKTELSKTPIKILKPKTQNSNLNNTIAEISKTSLVSKKAKINRIAESKTADVSKSTIKTETGTKSTASSKGNNAPATSRKIIPSSGNATKRDMTPIAKKNKLVNLDTSTISNLDMSAVHDNKGNQTNKNKNTKANQFSSKNNKPDLNKTVIETNKNPLSNKDKKPNTSTSKKPTGKDATGKPALNGKADKNTAKKEDKEKKITKEADNNENVQDNEDKADSILKKDNSVTNIMDIIAEKNKELNMEEILESEQKDKINNTKIENKAEKKEEENNVQINNLEEGKVNKTEEEKNAEIKDEIPIREEIPKENNQVNELKPIENEINSEKEKTTLISPNKNIPDYQNKNNKFLHQIIFSK